MKRSLAARFAILFVLFSLLNIGSTAGADANNTIGSISAPSSNEVSQSSQNRSWAGASAPFDRADSLSVQAAEPVTDTATAVPKEQPPADTAPTPTETTAATDTPPPSATNTATELPSATATVPPADTPTATPQPPPTFTATPGAHRTASPTLAPTKAVTTSPTITATATLATTPSPTPTGSITSTPTITATATLAASPTLTTTATITASPTVTTTPTITATATLTATPGITSTGPITVAFGGYFDIDTSLDQVLDLADGWVSVRFPAGVFGRRLRVHFDRPTTDFAKLDRRHDRVINMFSIRAFDRAKLQQEVKQFQKSIRLTVRYDPAKLGTWKERDLTIVYWDVKAEQWMPVASRVDIVRHTVTAETTHFTDYGLGTAPDVQNYLPTLTDFQVDTFTGSASASYSFEIPPGRGGLAPTLSLSYSSLSVDYMKDSSQASPVGTGWSMSESYIARDSRDSYDSTDDVYTLVTNGVGYDLYVSADGTFHTSSEQYWHITHDASSDSWLVITNDGTQYRYGTSAGSKAVWARTDGTATPHRSKTETYMWWLENVTDVHGNQIAYTYMHERETLNCIDSPVYTVDMSVYPQTISYNGGSTEISFSYQPRTDYQLIWPEWQCGRAPYAMSRLHQVDVSSRGFTGGDMLLLRRYVLTQDYTTFPGLLNYFGAGSGSYGRLTLKTIEHFGIHGQDAPALPAYSISYNADNVLSQASNGIGGAVFYTYDPVTVGQPLAASVVVHRVASKNVSDGSGSSAPFTYSYVGAAVNDPEHSAAAGTAHWGGHPRYDVSTQFRGHSEVVATDPTGAVTHYYFPQDDITAGRALTVTQLSSSGGKYTEVNNAYYTRCISVVDWSSTQAIDSCSHANLSGQTGPTTTGTLSEFVALSSAVKKVYDGQTTPTTTQESYAYDAYGNLSETDEYLDAGNSLFRRTTQTFYPNNNSIVWIVNRVGLKEVFDATPNGKLSETRYFYDGHPNYSDPPSKGDLTKVDVTADGTTFFS
ncbi:MAG: hypothetical protein M1482_04070 [Chloroflexi bacterium]|nr:hypothetical protein [Chloroflexota bacterium]